jgi:hypothetical protein
MADNPFEIPQAVRDLVEQNVKQTHAAYEQLNEFVTKAMGTWTGALPANPMASPTRYRLLTTLDRLHCFPYA